MSAASEHAPEYDRWMTDPADRDYLAPELRWCRVCALVHAPGGYFVRENSDGSADLLIDPAGTTQRRFATVAAAVAAAARYARLTAQLDAPTRCAS